MKKKSIQTSDYIETEWHKNGKKSFECHYKNDKKHGLEKKWDKFGEIIFKANYKEGKKNGTEELFFRYRSYDGVEYEYLYLNIYVCNFKNDKKNGTEELFMFHKDSQRDELCLTSNYKDGEKDGEENGGCYFYGAKELSREISGYFFHPYVKKQLEEKFKVENKLIGQIIEPSSLLSGKYEYDQDLGYRIYSNGKLSYAPVEYESKAAWESYSYSNDKLKSIEIRTEVERDVHGAGIVLKKIEFNNGEKYKDTTYNIQRDIWSNDIYDDDDVDYVDDVDYEGNYNGIKELETIYIKGIVHKVIEWIGCEIFGCYVHPIGKSLEKFNFSDQDTGIRTFPIKITETEYTEGEKSFEISVRNNEIIETFYKKGKLQKEVIWDMQKDYKDIYNSKERQARIDEEKKSKKLTKIIQNIKIEDLKSHLILFQTKYDKDQKVITREGFSVWPNGRKKFVETTKGGQSMQTYYDSSGAKSEERIFKDDNKILEKNYVDGEIISEYIFKDDEDETLKSEIIFEEGKKISENYFNDNGVLESEIIFEEGKKISETYFNDNGVKIKEKIYK